MIDWRSLARPGFAALALLLAVPCALPAAAEEPLDPLIERALSLESQALDIRRGQYLWKDDASGGGPATIPVTIIVSVPLQRAYAFRGLDLIGVAAVSTGKPGKSTPRGEFEILQKRARHHSNIYSNAPMPFMQRLTWTGIALHGGYDPGYPASHGCIRLPMEFARLLFGATAIGAQVSVVDDDVVAPPPPEERFVPMLVALPDRLPSTDHVFARGWSRGGVGVGAGVAPVTVAMHRSVGGNGLTVREAVFVAPRAELRLPGGALE